MKTWKLLQYLSAAAILLITTGCDTEKTSQLEKQVAELKTEAAKRQTAEDYNLQAKCSQDARTWFNQNYSSDKGTILLNYSNHYNKSLNQCFILVEYHFRITPNTMGTWVNNLTLWNVYENDKAGEFAESHWISDHIVTCVVGGKQCDSIEKFHELAQPYMNN